MFNDGGVVSTSSAADGAGGGRGGWIDYLAEECDVRLKASAAAGMMEEYTPEGNPGRFCGEMDVSRHDSDDMPNPGENRFRRYVFDSLAARLAGLVTGAETVNFFYDFLFVKEPGTGEVTRWHQDEPYWAVTGEHVCSVWMPLDPVPKETCLEFVAGSHRWNQTFAPIRFADGQPYQPTTLPLLPDIEAERNASAHAGTDTGGAVGGGDGGGSKHRILSWEMQPGDCLVFHSRVLHCAPPNASTVHRRRALSTRWCGERSRYAAPSGCVGIGYPNFEVPLVDGGSMVCPAFPIVWPRSHPERPRYDPNRRSCGGGGGTNELLPEDVAAAYERLRTEQASKYSLQDREGGQARSSSAMMRRDAQMH